MKDVSSRQLVDEMLLRQIGAEVLSVKGVNSFVKFHVNGQKVNYLFNINHKNLYYLQRISPYQMPLGIFENAEEVVDAIKSDYEKFQTASTKDNFKALVQLNEAFLEARQQLEEKFIREEIDGDYLDKICTKLKEV